MSLHDDLDELADICEHMKPVGQWPRAKAIRALREAAALARRVEGAPSVEITACNQIEDARDFDYGDMAAAVQKFDAGQRVRLVPEAGKGVA